jgi:hypothetical protein
MNRILCAHCGRDFLSNPRVKNQRYCNRPECQRVRKTLWQRQKLATDPDYQANQRDCWKNWRQRHPEYWQQYRQRHPRVRERNRLLQRVRNTKRLPARRVNMDMIANMDALTPCFSYKHGPYYLVPSIANMDAIPSKVFIIPAP